MEHQDLENVVGHQQTPPEMEQKDLQNVVGRPQEPPVEEQRGLKNVAELRVMEQQRARSSESRDSSGY